MKKNKIIKITTAIITSFIMVFSIMAPITVYGDDSFNYTISFSIADGTNHTLDNRDDGLIIDGKNVMLWDKAKNEPMTEGVVYQCNNEKTQCTITATNQHAGSLNYNSFDDQTQTSLFKLKLKEGENYITINADHDFIGNSEVIVTDDTSYTVNFNNKMYFVWNCDGGFCKKHITNISESADQKTNMATTKYIPVSEIVDETDNTKTFDFSITNSREPQYYWVWDSAFTSFSAVTTWDEFEETMDNLLAGLDEEESYDKQRSILADPCGAENGVNSISTNGDRNFRATIYDDTRYFGVSNASTIEDLTYYPGFWDPGMYNPSHDVSETTIDRPAIISAYLLEPKITLTNDIVSGAITSVEVASDIPSSAVTITSNAGKWDIVFNSSYYSEVTFKINNKYYVQIKRINIMEDENGLALLTPTTDTNSYDMIAKIEFEDGTSKVVVMKYKNTILDDQGKGLSIRKYGLKDEDEEAIANINSEATGVYVNVIKKGSTSSTFSGLFSGNKKGTYIDLRRQ